MWNVRAFRFRKMQSRMRLYVDLEESFRCIFVAYNSVRKFVLINRHSSPKVGFRLSSAFRQLKMLYKPAFLPTSFARADSQKALRCGAYVSNLVWSMAPHFRDSCGSLHIKRRFCLKNCFAGKNLHHGCFTYYCRHHSWSAHWFRQ